MDIRTSYRVQHHCPPDIRYSGPPALVFLHASIVKGTGDHMRHTAPQQEKPKLVLDVSATMGRFWGLLH